MNGTIILLSLHFIIMIINNKEAGYSLAELIVTVVLIGVAFPGLIGFMTGTMTDTVKNECISQAIVLAGEKMEEICCDKNEASRGIPYITTPNRYPQEAIDQFMRTVTVRNSVLNGVSIIEVTVSVSHSVMNGPYTLNHIFTDYSGN
ncbi:MAG: hypothetical protein P8X42_05805 [Calditrichaceae bacterium]|jgi:Tfp pilus assembly protein FimT